MKIYRGLNIVDKYQCKLQMFAKLQSTSRANQRCGKSPNSQTMYWGNITYIFTVDKAYAPLQLYRSKSCITGSPEYIELTRQFNSYNLIWRNHLDVIFLFMAGMLQLLLVSNLLLWEYVVSLPLCLEIEGSNELTIEELFDDAIGMAQYTSNLTTQISEEFVST